MLLCGLGHRVYIGASTGGRGPDAQVEAKAGIWLLELPEQLIR